jgi:hypothetical protein
MSEASRFLGRSVSQSARAGLPVGALAAIVAAAVVGVLVVGCGSRPARATPTPAPTPTAARTPPAPTCNPSGCAVVSLSRTLPPVTIFYGASCSGVDGAWFFNVTEQGSTNELRPSYALRWSFASGSRAALPNGIIRIPATSSTQATLTLINGGLSLTGAQKPNTAVKATGTLTIQLSGPASASVLTFTETGLRRAERALGLVSPFDLSGQPLTVPVKTVTKLSGC